jgi:hypothetical protein
MSCHKWSAFFFSFISNEISLEDRCRKYWDKYLIALADTFDGELILEQANLNVIRDTWLRKEKKIKWIYRSKRFVEHIPLLERITRWCSNIPVDESIPNFEFDEVFVLANFPDTF